MKYAFLIFSSLAAHGQIRKVTLPAPGKVETKVFSARLVKVDMPKLAGKLIPEQRVVRVDLGRHVGGSKQVVAVEAKK